MPIYIYETVEEPARRFEVKQAMSEPALTQHPETGEPVRRVITGGYGFLPKGGSGAQAAPTPAGGCGSGCGCH